MEIPKYPISVEISGDFAMFANPESGGDAVSYAAPPFSTVKGMLESIAFVPGAKILPRLLHICRPLNYMRHSYNCTVSDLRKSDLIKKQNALQRREMILVDVVYQIFADVVNMCPIQNRQNHAHALQRIFTKRVKRGTPKFTVSLGRTDYPAAYIGPIRPTSAPDVNVNLVLPQFLHHPFAKDQTPPGEDKIVSPRFHSAPVRIIQGVLDYAFAA